MYTHTPGLLCWSTFRYQARAHAHAPQTRARDQDRQNQCRTPSRRRQWSSVSGAGTCWKHRWGAWSSHACRLRPPAEVHWYVCVYIYIHVSVCLYAGAWIHPSGTCLSASDRPEAPCHVCVYGCTGVCIYVCMYVYRYIYNIKLTASRGAGSKQTCPWEGACRACSAHIQSNLENDVFLCFRV